MKRISNRTIFAVSAILIMVWFATIAIQIRRSVARETRRHGRYSSADAIANVTRLCPLVAPETEMRSCGVSYVETFSPFHGSYGIWAVQCTDSADGDCRETNVDVCFHWNAATGKLTWVSRSKPAGLDDGRRISPGEAIACARRWLRKLGMMEESPSWHNWAAPQRKGYCWEVRFYAGPQRAAVEVSSTDGSLQLARVW